jgi:uncharacterized protein (TIGR02453 family)
MPTESRFTGFPPQALTFLQDLAANNDKAWFTAHKADYERHVLAPFRLLLAEVISGLAARDIPITGDPAKSIFRIHRDVRFSANKTPYKTHAGAALTRDGSKSGMGVIYIHIEPSGCFLASGFYHPEKEQLAALREAIYTESDRLLALRADLAEAGLTLDPEDSLTRQPRGFEEATDPAILAALRLKSFVVREQVTTARIGEPAWVNDILTFAEAALGLLRFGWAALSVLDPMDLKR